MHFLVIDKRYGVPIYVFLERDPNEAEGRAALRGRWVTVEPAASSGSGSQRESIELGRGAAIGGDPRQPDRFAVFASDGQVRAAGYSLIEPSYLGPSWETYLSVFHPEGGKRLLPTHSRARVGR